MDVNIWLLLFGMGNALMAFASAIILGKWGDLAMRKWFKIFLSTSAAVLAVFAITNVIVLTVMQDNAGLIWSSGLQFLSSAIIVLVLAVTGRKQGNRRREEITTVPSTTAPLPSDHNRMLGFEDRPLSEVLTEVQGDLEYITQSFERRTM